MDYQQALNRAAAYCSRAERAPRDVEQKLHDWEVDEADIERVMEYLRRERFLDDERFVHAFINDKYTYERWGRIKITYALRQKGYSGNIVSNMLDDVIDPEHYAETLTELMRGKMRGMHRPLSPADRMKLCRFAAQRGFEGDVTSSVLRRLNVAEGEDL